MRLKLIIALTAGTSVVPAPGLAGPIMIAPTTVEVAPARHSASIEITNTDDVPADLQLRSYAWRQVEGRDVLTPTDELTVSPAIVTIAPRAKQVFRILRTASAAPGVEPSYRLKINQLPRPGTPGITVNFELLVPVFFPAAAARPALVWTLAGDQVVIQNTGNRRARLSQLSVVDQGGRMRLLRNPQPNYILAGSWRRYDLTPGGAIPARARLIAADGSEPIDAAPSAMAAR